MEAHDVATLYFFEISRSIVTVGMVVLLVYMLVRRNAACWRPLSLALAFATIWHTKMFGYSRFPGAYQERMALWLRGHHAAPAILKFLFGSPAWSLWGALAAMVYFSTVYPARLDAGSIRHSGGHDRTGIGGNSVAGADVGAQFRRLTASLIENGWTSGRSLFAFTIVWSVLFQIAGDATAMKVVAALLIGLSAGVIVTNVRASQRTHTMEWLGRAVLYSAALFGLSAAATFLLQRRSPLPGVILLGLSPVAAAVCCWVAVAGAGADPVDATDSTYEVKYPLAHE
jgi:hypothetical protein